MKITKQSFVSAINALQQQQKHNEEFAKALSKAFKVEIPEHKIHFITIELTRILCELTNDTGGFSWIEWYMHTLDYGKKHYLKPPNSNGNKIDLSDAGKLYDHLKEINDKKQCKF